MTRYRFALSPKWFILHVITVVLVVTMVLLGRWQLTVSNQKGFDLQNFGYAFQWWAFSIFTVVMWGRIIRDTRRRLSGELPAAGVPGSAEARAAALAPVAYRRYIMPSSSNPEPPVDAEHAAYNEYLTQLASRDAQPKDGRRVS